MALQARRPAGARDPGAPWWPIALEPGVLWLLPSAGWRLKRIDGDLGMSDRVPTTLQTTPSGI